VGALATTAAAVVGPAVASYTGALVADTAVPAWHDGHREMPLLFAASGGSAAAGLGLVVAPHREASPARRLALVATAAELGLEKVMEDRMHPAVAEAYHTGKAGSLLRTARGLAVGGALVATTWGRRSRAASAVGGAALVAASAMTRFGIFHAGMQSARDPRATVVPQRERADARP
jgi:hypothetical protein